MEPITVFWFRRDLRLNDNAGLYHALKERGNVLPLFIFDLNILEKLSSREDHRVSFIFDQLQEMQKSLRQYGSSLIVRYGRPVEVFEKLINEFPITAVYTNHDYEPYARERDESVGRLLSTRGIDFRTFKDQVIFEKDEVIKENGEPFTVFTPYMKRWRQKFTLEPLPVWPSENWLNRCVQVEPQPFSLDPAGFRYVKVNYPPRDVDTDIIRNYHKTRDFPAIPGTSRLSVHLRFGTISIRELVRTAAALNDTFLNELIWREFYMMILWFFPHVVNRSFKPQYDNIRWINDEKLFQRWCEGLTGYPIVDAGMRQLNQTGYMHNRLRMITASFLTKHLLIDWRWGEAYFAEKLLDFELSSNNGGWQWSAGTGCDAAPYFRIFNPELQTLKFDPDKQFIRTWVPEFDKAGYPEPVVDHQFSRQRALKVYQQALDAG